jgi:phosphohistidine phosphatase SixA
MMRKSFFVPLVDKAAKLPRLGKTSKVLMTTAAIAVSLLVLTGYTYWPRSPIDLATDSHQRIASLYDSWKKGEVVMLVRHGERCDRSSNDCVGPRDGITLHGQQVSADVGRSLEGLGLTQTDVIASPSTRTLQTAEFLVGHPVGAQDWLFDCEKMNLDQVMAHKAGHRNLVLVTHSGCISQIEKQQGYYHADMSDYDSAVFISMNREGRPVIRGLLNPDGWDQLTLKGDN